MSDDYFSKPDLKMMESHDSKPTKRLSQTATLLSTLKQNRVGHRPLGSPDRRFPDPPDLATPSRPRNSAVGTIPAR